MAKFLVTGGSGFIGTHLVDFLLGRGDAVVSIDVAEPQKDEHRAIWQRLDLMDEAAVSDVCAAFQPDAIVNLAAVADLSISLEAMAVNTAGLENLLRAVADQHPRPRLVHISTQLVVGAGSQAGGPRDYHPYTAYGESKARSEEVLWDWPDAPPWVVIRPCVVWGPRSPALAKAAWYYLKKGWYLVPSRNSAIRTYSFVANLVEQICAAATLPPEDVSHKVFYGGDCNLDSAVWLDAFARAMTGRAARRFPYSGLRLLALAGDLLDKLGVRSPIDSGRLFRMTEDYPNPIDETHRILGKPRHTMEDGVAATVAWLQDTYPDTFA